MSDSIYMLDESGSPPTTTSNMCTKGLNLSKDFISSDHVADIYKNNNNNIEDGPVSPSIIHGNIDNYVDNLGDEKVFSKRRESLSDECKMNASPKDRERASGEEEDMEFSSAQRRSSSSEELCDTNDVKHVIGPEQYSSSVALQKRPMFDSEPSERAQSRNPSPDYSHLNSSSDGHLSQRELEQPTLPSNFMGAETENNEEMSDNEMICDDYESDSESNEPRITVREALMNRALAAAAAAASSSSASHHPNFSTCIDRSGETFASEPGGSGRTSRSGGMSPSTSPSVRSSNSRGVAPGRNESSPSSSLLNKESFVNGHSGLRPPVSHSGERYYHPHGHHPHQSHHRTSYGAHQQGHGSHSKHSQQYRDPVKSEHKSHSSSPLLADVKPENAMSNLSNIQNSIGNALLNLASLGSLAALQQSLPGLLSSVGGTGSTSGGNVAESSPSRTSPRIGVSDASPSPAATPSINAPLNLTHSTGGGALTKNYHHHHHHQTGHPSNSNHSRSQRSSSPSAGQFALQSSFSHNNSMAVGNSNSILAGGGIIPANLSSYFGPSTGSGGVGGSGSSSFIPNSSQLSNSLSLAAASLQSPGSLPQLVLASGQIMQGIQGAQLLIPTAQGIMTQMILTIPLTQPGSPQNLMNTPNQNTNSPAIGAASGQSSSSPHSRSNRIQNRSHHHGLSHCNANSPPIASTVPPSSSPDYSGPAGTIPNSLLNLSPHLVNQSLGAHIPVDKMGMDRTGGMNGVRSTNLKRDNTGSMISSNPNLYPPKMSPCSGSGHDSDKGSDAEDSDQMVDGINLDEIKEFAKAFKLRRLSLGLTQTQVGQALSVTEGPAYSQSAICSALAWQLAQSQSQLSQSNRTSLPQPSMFEKLDITPKSAQKIKPVLERWMKEAEDRYKNGHQNLNEFVGMEPSKKRKRRTSFTPQALEILNTQFERNTHPSGAEITTLAHQLGYEREVIRIWFCNKRQALKNTVRMMSKGSSPI